MDEIEQAAAALDQALRSYETNRRALFASDGKTPIYPEQRHEKMLAEVRAALSAAASEAMATAQVVMDQAAQERLAFFACPTLELSKADLAEADGLARFVKEECDDLPLSELAERLRWAASGAGGKSREWLYPRYARQRFAAESRKSTPAAGLSDLSAVLRDIEDKRGASERRHELEDRVSERNQAAFRLRAKATQALDPGKPRPVVTL